MVVGRLHDMMGHILRSTVLVKDHYSSRPFKYYFNDRYRYFTTFLISFSYIIALTL